MEANLGLVGTGMPLSEMVASSPNHDAPSDHMGWL